MREEEENGFSDQAAFSAEEVGEFVGEVADAGSGGYAGFLRELAKGGVEVGFAGFDVAFGVVPVAAVIEQEIKRLGGILRAVEEDDSGGAFLLGHGDKSRCEKRSTVAGCWH